MAKPTHRSKKTGREVLVDRLEGNTIVVKNKRGKFLGSYTKSEMKKFNDRYESLRAGKGD